MHELKGTGDLDPLEQCSHRFVSGIDDESIAYAAESLKLLRAEIGRRTERLKALPRELCPDKQVTRRDRHQAQPEAVADRLRDRRGAEPVRPREVRQAGRRRRRVHHQDRPARSASCWSWPRSGPTRSRCRPASAANVRPRFCLKVMDQIENDMVLGTSAYKNGIRATTFRAEVDAGLGYLVGASAQAQVVRTYYLNMHATERVAKRARALREAAGTLSGVALGEDDSAPQRDVLADVAEVVRRRQRACTGRRSPTGSPSGSPSGGTTRPATRCGPSSAPAACRSVVVVMDGTSGPRLPRRRRRQGGERHMTPPPMHTTVTALTCTGTGQPLPPLPGRPL